MLAIHRHEAPGLVAASTDPFGDPDHPISDASALVSNQRGLSIA